VDLQMASSRAGLPDTQQTEGPMLLYQTEKWLGDSKCQRDCMSLSTKSRTL